MVTFSPVAVVSVNPEEDTLVIVPTDPPAAGPDRALEPLPDPTRRPGCCWRGPRPGRGAAGGGVPAALLPQAATAAITAAAAPAAMTLLRLLENICLTPVVEILDLRYRRPRWKFGGRSPEGGCKVVQRGLTAKALAKVGKVTPKVPGRRHPPRPEREHLINRRSG